MARIFVTGGVRCEGPDGSFADADLPGAQGRAAFGILVLERRPLTRDALADLVWGEALPAQWNGALTSILSKVRRLVTGTGLDGGAVVASAGGTCAIHLPADAWVDVEEAGRRLDAAEGALRRGDAVSATTDATVASAVLRRPLLPGLSGDWIEARRAQHDDALQRCLLVLATGWNARGNHDLAAIIAADAVSRDALRERAHRELIRAELGRGDRGAALRAYDRCVRVLDDELAIAPDPATRALIAHLDS
ncbi:bacterial transcriptional activator domain-containing protein [Microbacter sp. GSS18]|nr:bacterial transcriptional activator domain-containing protein [Microbacter sp. GSS18]